MITPNSAATPARSGRWLVNKYVPFPRTAVLQEHHLLGVFTFTLLLSGQRREYHGAILREAAMLAGAGQLTIRMDKQYFALDEVNEAFRLVADGSGKGKTVIWFVSD